MVDRVVYTVHCTLAVYSVVYTLMQWIVHTLAGPPIVPSLADVGQEPASSLPSPSYLQDGDNETIEMMMLVAVSSTMVVNYTMVIDDNTMVMSLFFPFLSPRWRQ